MCARLSVHVLSCASPLPTLAVFTGRNNVSGSVYSTLIIHQSLSKQTQLCAQRTHIGENAHVKTLIVLTAGKRTGSRFSRLTVTRREKCQRYGEKRHRSILLCVLPALEAAEWC